MDVETNKDSVFCQIYGRRDEYRQRVLSNLETFESWQEFTCQVNNTDISQDGVKLGTLDVQV